ncbi:synaptonemal complex central element protein 2 isoform X1 [Ascaphus truei]|uniref:synaptonemal complex central element protein 2 isoform X1 n=2 Tax=Ascaphus truei TaxID=8439 RepID=UPI003F5AC539
MSDREFEAREDQERPLVPCFSPLDRAGLPPNEAASRPQSPSLPTPAAEMAAAGRSEGKSANYFAALDASMEALQSRAQHLIDKINESRNQDQAMMKNFNDSLALKVTELSQRLEDRMYRHYDHQNTLLQDKLQELPEIIERIGQLQGELKQVCQTVVTVYKDLCVQPEI